MSGRLLRILDATFSSSLPQYISYDASALKQQILSWKNLQAFYDFGDANTITADGSSKVSQVNDQGPKALHLTASGSFRPTFVAGSIPGSSGAAGIYFDGTNKLTNANLFSGNPRGTIIIGLYATGLTDATSRIFLSTAASASTNFFAVQTQLRMFSSTVVLTVPAVNTRFFCPMFSWDTLAGKGNIISSIGANNFQGNTAQPAPVGAGNVGWWNDAAAGNQYIGYISHLILLNEDISLNPTFKLVIENYEKVNFVL
ncbi:MAG: hypothetical protein LRY50_07505 [Geovibrio sp.]|nr:hypothetical protein [Geovibrio sp.]